MLELHFINVADGDAILIEDRNESSGAVFRLLVDTGQPMLDPWPGSLRQTAAEYLRGKRVDYIDMLVVTHLHVDHFGGLEALLPEVRFGKAYAGFFPAGSGARVAPEPEAQKTVQGMIDCVNRWAAVTETLRAAGTELCTVTESLSGLRLTETLSADIICPSGTLGAVQRLTWEAMLAGRPVTEELKYRVSKSRNPNSLRMTLTYAGRRVELAADCFGWVWDSGTLAPCDILKVPHHGDVKSLTEPLLQKLRPAWAVISCEAQYIARKDRPSRAAAELLERYGVRCWFTDCFAADWHTPDRWSSVDFTIYDDGTVLTPDKEVSRYI